ncbi:carbohydrate kinase family protein [Sinomonas sp. G460-2]|uniref:carbohydrate kinase family protein n=1 Tax=Sinomonas sp. G460-2 TaxID=3393464 RepID=UPI0039EE1A14
MLVFVGVATADAIALVDRYPDADERIVAQDVLFAGGGPAATAAVAAARLGIDAALVSAVGDDDEGHRIVEGLAAEGVDVSGIRRIPGGRSARSVVVIDGPHRTRAIVNRPGPDIELDTDPAARALIEASDWVHVDQLGWGPVRRFVNRLAQFPRLSVDAGNPIPGYTQAGTALYAPTLPALMARYGSHVGPNDTEALLRRALADGAQIAVATGGGDGSWGIAGNGTLRHATPPPADIASTLGAGDVFHGALLAGLVRAARGEFEGLGEALAYATTVASLSCRGIDGRSRIPDHAEALRCLAASTAPATQGEDLAR